jgi:hypothetical protein
MQLTKITSTSRSKSLLIKGIFILVIFIAAIAMLGKIDFPAPNKDLEKIIPNEKLKIVK